MVCRNRKVDNMEGRKKKLNYQAVSFFGDNDCRGIITVPAAAVKRQFSLETFNTGEPRIFQYSMRAQTVGTHGVPTVWARMECPNSGQKDLNLQTEHSVGSLHL